MRNKKKFNEFMNKTIDELKEGQRKNLRDS